jgi:predicted transcriptional regulator
MNTTQMLDRSTNAPDMPDDLTAADSKLVYLFVAISDGATVDDLQTALNIKKISLFPVLDTLSERGLIEHTEDQYVTASAS